MIYFSVSDVQRARDEKMNAKPGGGRLRRRNALTLETTLMRRKPANLRRRFSSYVQNTNSRVSIAFKHKVGPGESAFVILYFCVNGFKTIAPKNVDATSN